MAVNSSKTRITKAHLLLAELQAEARRERFAAAFNQHFPSVEQQRQHPRYGWLWLALGDWHRTLEMQPAPEFRRWCEEEQMPKLAKNPHYHDQFEARIDERRRRLESLQNGINRGRLDLEPAAGMARREIRWLSELISTCSATARY